MNNSTTWAFDTEDIISKIKYADWLRFTETIEFRLKIILSSVEIFHSVLVYLVFGCLTKKFPRALLSFALVVGLINIFLLAEWQKIEFVIENVMLFTIGYIIARVYKNLCGYYHVILGIVLHYQTMFCFRHYFTLESPEEYIFSYMILCMKYYSVAEAHERQPGGFLKDVLELWIFLLFPPWMTFDDFRKIPLIQREKDSTWCSYMVKNMMKIFNTVFAPEIIYYTILWTFDIVPFLVPVILGVNKTFTYRCRYYYRAQIANFQILAIGIPQTENTDLGSPWKEGYVIDVLEAELSNAVMKFLAKANKPLAIFLRTNFVTNNGIQTAWLYLFIILFTIAYYNWYISLFCLVVIIGILSHSAALNFIDKSFKTCVLSCGVLPCRHMQRHSLQRQVAIYFVKCLSLVWFYFNLSCIFRFKPYDPEFSIMLYYLGLIILTNCVIASCCKCKIRYMPAHGRT